MTISKRQHNTGQTGNHGMQEIDATEILKRRMLEDKYHEESSKITCHCKNGHEFTILGQDITIEESSKLSFTIWARKLCPYCNGTALENHDLKEVSFIRKDKRYNTIFKPTGYVFLPAL